MSIDGIGKPSGLPEAPTGVAAAEDGTEAQGVLGPEPTGVEPNTDFAALERGELSVDAFLERQVDGAVQHLSGQVPAAELEFIRQELRFSLEADPVLARLVRQATSGAR
jgi:hypothetical protein